MGRWTVPVLVAGLVVMAGLVVAVNPGSVIGTADPNDPGELTDEQEQTDEQQTTEPTPGSTPGGLTSTRTPSTATPGTSQPTLTVQQTVSGGAGGGGYAAAPDAASSAGAGAASNVGVSVGGAQDANSFRQNVKEGYVPPLRTLTHEGLFHDYYFDTNMDRECTAQFCPSYSRAVTRDPISNESERYLTVGLNSGITQSEFQRKNLNLVVVVDTSGSMSSPFDQYYYDGGERKEIESEQTKMAAASDAVTSLTDQLGPNDRLSIVTYNNNARVVQELETVEDMDMTTVRSKVRSLAANGGTNLAAGRSRAIEQLRAVDTERDNRSTRIIYVTDAMPNLGTTNDQTLRDRLQEDANLGVHSTFVGVGVDFNAELVDTLSDVRGANYYTVKSPQEFDERMGEGFQYMVTPLAYDLTLRVDGADDAIEHVYGTPGGDGATARTGELLNVTTLFPSRSEGNKTEGSVILLELDESVSESVTLNASYRTPDGTAHSVTRTVQFEVEDRSAPYYESTGVRKAVVLTRYANLLQNWAAHEHAQASERIEPEQLEPQPPRPDGGIEYRDYDSQWEQTSVPLQVSPPFDKRITTFESYFTSEATALDSDRFEDDLAVFDRLTNETAP